MSYFYEIRSADNTLLKRDGGFPTVDAAKVAARDDAKKMKNGWPSILNFGCPVLHYLNL